MRGEMDKEELDTEQSILNIGAGKVDPLILQKMDSYFLVNLDIMYEECFKRTVIENRQKIWETCGSQLCETYLCNEGWEEFLSKYRLTFDRIVLYRFLEHIRMTQVLFFIYSMSTVLKVGGYVEVIVPNYEELAKRILQEDPEKTVGFEGVNILNTTELLNEPEDPHASIWTPKRAKYFFELEGRFEVYSIAETCKFDGRDIYMWFLARRI